jgi:CBS domain containing-hemolysin-like protein
MISDCAHVLLALAADQAVSREWDVTAGEALWNASVVFFFVVLNGFFVAAEFALVKVRDSQLQEEIAEGNARAKFARKITHNLDAYLSAAQLGVTLASIALGVVAEPYLARMLQPLLFMAGIQREALVHSVAFVIAYSMITYLHVVLGEQGPKVFAIRRALTLAIWLSYPLHVFYMIFKPAIWLLNTSSNALVKHVFRLDPVSGSERVHSEEELKHIVAESQRSEEVTETEKRIVLNALALNDRYVRDVMTPRKDVVSLDVDESFENNLKVAIESKHTRFPTVEGHLDHSVGLVHIKDMLRLLHAPEAERDLRKIKRDLLLVPEMMPLDKLLRQFLAKHAHLALAVDEYGGAVGIVTLDNVVEEIVGDIQDEFDTAEKPEFRRITEDEFEVEGTLNLYELNDLTDLNLESDEVTTVGGYVTHALGHFPKMGEKLVIENYEVTTTKVEARRVGQLHFRRLEKTAEELEADAEAVEEAQTIYGGSGHPS